MAQPAVKGMALEQAWHHMGSTPGLFSRGVGCSGVGWGGIVWDGVEWGGMGWGRAAVGGSAQSPGANQPARLQSASGWVHVHLCEEGHQSLEAA